MPRLHIQPLLYKRLSVSHKRLQLRENYAVSTAKCKTGENESVHLLRDMRLTSSRSPAGIEFAGREIAAERAHKGLTGTMMKVIALRRQEKRLRRQRVMCRRCSLYLGARYAFN